MVLQGLRSRGYVATAAVATESGDYTHWPSQLSSYRRNGRTTPKRDETASAKLMACSKLWVPWQNCVNRK